MFSSIKIDGKNATPDCVYYNGTIVNNSKETNHPNDDPEVEFEDSRQTPLVKDASEYEVSVENFTMNGASKTLPLFIPIISDPSADINTTVYTVSFGVFDGTNYVVQTIPIYWVPENQTSYTTIPELSSVQIDSDYYYCYTYTHWVSLVNTALVQAWTNAGGGVSFGTQCPWFEFDQTTGLFSINQDSKTCMVPVGNATPLPAPYNVSYIAAGLYSTGEYSFVGMNVNLDNLLSNFNSTSYGSNKAWGTTILPEIVINMGLNDSMLTGIYYDSPIGISLRTLPKTSIFQLANPFNYTPISTGIFVRLIQDYISTGGNWSPIASLVLGTTKIPVRNELMANPIQLGTANFGGQTASSGSFQKVLIEFPINATKSDLCKGFIFYEPLTPTFSSMDPSHEGISDVDINVYWRNRLTNSLIPVRLPNQSSVSFRLLFKKKYLIPSCFK
jgi:hypothetical protein